MSKSYCMKCEKEVDKNIKQCECGGRSFAYGDKFHFVKNGIVCDCGNDKFNANIHKAYTDKIVNSYVCDKCCNSIRTESYRTEEDFMLLDDKY